MVKMNDAKVTIERQNDIVKKVAKYDARLVKEVGDLIMDMNRDQINLMDELIKCKQKLVDILNYVRNTI